MSVSNPTMPGPDAGLDTAGESAGRANERAAAVDPLWRCIHDEVGEAAAHEPTLASFLHASVLSHARMDSALAFQLGARLEHAALGAASIRDMYADAARANPELLTAARADVRASYERDPAVEGYYVPFLYHKGYHALQAYRLSHALWGDGRKALARFVQSRTSEVLGVDIHPAACIGRGIFIDHATSVVIGETAVVEDNVSILHEVTLGGTGKDSGDRHPKIGRGVLIGAGAKILGNVTVGQCSKVGAGSVVLSDVPPRTTVVGVPAVAVGETDCAEPSLEMDHRLPDCCA